MANLAGNNLMEKVYGPKNLSNDEKMHAAYPEPKLLGSNEKNLEKLWALNRTVKNHSANVQAHRLGMSRQNMNYIDAKQKYNSTHGESDRYEGRRQRPLPGELSGGRGSRKSRRHRKHRKTRRHRSRRH